MRDIFQHNKLEYFLPDVLVGQLFAHIVSSTYQIMRVIFQPNKLEYFLPDVLVGQLFAHIVKTTSSFGILDMI